MNQNIRTQVHVENPPKLRLSPINSKQKNNWNMKNRLLASINFLFIANRSLNSTSWRSCGGGQRWYARLIQDLRHA